MCRSTTGRRRCGADGDKTDLPPRARRPAPRGSLRRVPARQRNCTGRRPLPGRPRSARRGQAGASGGEAAEPAASSRRRHSLPALRPRAMSSPFCRDDRERGRVAGGRRPAAPSGTPRRWAARTRSGTARRRPSASRRRRSSTRARRRPSPRREGRRTPPGSPWCSAAGRPSGPASRPPSAASRSAATRRMRSRRRSPARVASAPRASSAACAARRARSSALTAAGTRPRPRSSCTCSPPSRG